MSIFSKFLHIFLQNLARKNPANNSPQKSTRDFSTAILQSALKALAFFAFLYAIDALFRAIFILNIGILERHLGSAESSEFLQAFINGARYFGQVAGVLASIIFALFLCGIWRQIFNKIAFIYRVCNLPALLYKYRKYGLLRDLWRCFQCEFAWAYF